MPSASLSSAALSPGGHQRADQPHAATLAPADQGHPYADGRIFVRTRVPAGWTAQGAAMAPAGHLRPGDWDAVLRLIDVSRHRDPGPAMPWSVIHDLNTLFPGSYALYQEYDVARRRWVIGQKVDPGGAEHVDGETTPLSAEVDALFFALWWADPMLRHHQTGRDRHGVLLSTDFFPSQRALLARPYGRELCPHLRAFMIIPLSSHDGYVRRVTLAREDRRPFTERDRQVATLLRPHLYELWLDAERRRLGPARLTDREWEVLALSASGLTYAEVAARLVISVGTVRKHMEHVRTRLGVHTAAAAAAAALPGRP